MCNDVITVDGAVGDVSADLMKAATDIRRRHAGIASEMVEIGKTLLWAKEECSHGVFLTWLERDVGIAPRLAQMYMRAAEWSRVDRNAKLISHLQPTAVLKLAAKSTPESVVSAVAEKIDTGSLVKLSDVDVLLADARDKKRKAAEQARLEARSPAAKAAERRRREKAKLEDAERERRYREEQDRAWEMAVEAATIIRGRLTVEEWDRLFEILTPKYYASSRILDAMGMSRFVDPGMDGYMPAAFKAYDDPDKAKLLEENANLREDCASMKETFRLIRKEYEDEGFTPPTFVPIEKRDWEDAA
ncbi:MAG: hypothetical protein WBG88_02645 [Mesorhizobium sp.]